MDFSVLTLFPELMDAFFHHGMIQKGIDKGLITARSIQIRNFAADRHGTVDDKPYGGGSGMVMKPDILKEAILAAKNSNPDARVILTSPQGTPFTQKKAWAFARQRSGLIFICGRYEGVDERIFSQLIDEEVSIGDYVMTGGELAAMVMIDATARLIPGVLGNSESVQTDSFSNERLEYAQYTRPENFEDLNVPNTLLSGNHEAIRKWRTRSAFERTFLKRPDLLEKRPLDKEEKQIARQWIEALEKLTHEKE